MGARDTYTERYGIGPACILLAALGLSVSLGGVGLVAFIANGLHAEAAVSLGPWGLLTAAAVAFAKRPVDRLASGLFGTAVTLVVANNAVVVWSLWAV